MTTDQQSQPNLQNQVLVPSSVSKLICGIAASEADQFLYPADSATRIIQYSPLNVTNWDTFKKAIYLQKSKNINLISAVELQPLPNTKVVSSLFNGFGYSALNKALTRTYRYTAQATFQDKLKTTFDPLTKNLMDPQTAKTFYGGLGGMVSGVTETVIFHPLDTFKIRKVLETKNGTGIYSGLGPAVLRNTLSAGLFFGTYNYLTGYNQQNDKPNFLASTAAAVTTSVLTNPIDVVKTRIQGQEANKSGTNKLGLFAMGKKMYAEGGVKPFTKGMLVKASQSPLKVALPFFVFNEASQALAQYNKLHEKKDPTLRH